MKKKNNLSDYQIVLRYVKVNAEVSKDIYDEDDIITIKNIVKMMSKTIAIDKTYVNFLNTKYIKTFIREDSWNEFCLLLNDTKLGKKATKSQYTDLQVSYYLLVINYLYMCLLDFGYSSEGIYLEIEDKSLYMVEIYIDNYKEYLSYCGKWQNWKV